MGVVNRRNAVIGWAVLKLGKRVATRKAREAAPGTVDDTRRPSRSAIAIGLAGIGGALMFWHRRRGEDDSE